MKDHATTKMIATVALAGFVLMGCATSDPTPPETYGYSLPDDAAGTPLIYTIARPADEVRRVMTDQLTQAGLDLVIDRPDLVVASFSGHASAFVDCGTIIRRSDTGNEVVLPATTPTLQLRENEVSAAGLDPEDKSVLRHISLDARLMIAFEPDGKTTKLRANAHYVLIKTLDVLDEWGKLRASQRDAIAFASGFQAAFEAGTHCQSSGQLEKIGLVSHTQSST